MATTTTPGRGGRFSLSPPWERLINGLSILALVLVLVALVLDHLPSNFLILLPASAQTVDPVISVAGHPAPSGRGSLLFTFVEEPDSNLLQEIFAHFDPDASLEAKPPSFSATQYQQQNVQLMLGSEQTAELVALCHSGYTNLCGTGAVKYGVLVSKLEPWTHARGLLRPGDVITTIDGKQLLTPDQLHAALLARAPGSRFTVGLLRNGKPITVAVPTVRSPSDPHGAVFGITIMLTQLLPHLPVDIKINPGNVGGPSAGLMFTLGILQRLSPTDLTHGYKIAGTGTINLDGSVGAIGGVKQKVIGAQWSHARYFFVPYDGGNYLDARKAVGAHMMLVPVHTIDDALHFLQRLK